MTKRTIWLGVALALLAVVVGTQYVRIAVGHSGPTGTTAATVISPEELTRNAGPMPVTKIESYF